MMKSQRGIALLTVLWVLTLLMVIVFSFSFLARTETLSTMAFKEGMEQRFLAEAGIERGIVELIYRKQNLLIEDRQVWKTDGTPFSDQLGDGGYRVKLFDESGKIDINFAPEILLKNLIQNLGLEGEALDTVVDSIMDWKDKDDLHCLHGAESDYYQSLPNPYKAKNGFFDTLEELLMVKGVTREILFGSEKQKGLMEFLTVHGKTARINVNAAPKEVLTAIPGVTAEMAEALITYRQVQEVKNMPELGTLWGQNLAQINPFVSLSSSNTFTIESLGYKKNHRSGSGIRATITLVGNNQYKVLYYKTLDTGPLGVNETPIN
ncbi:MAG: hypothetical protein V2B13_15770 [Pseudomonadota bacterium]